MSNNKLPVSKTGTGTDILGFFQKELGRGGGGRLITTISQPTPHEAQAYSVPGQASNM